MLEDVITVFLLQPPEDSPGDEIVPEVVQVEADLEVDEVWPAIITLKDVLRLVGVDVSDVAGVELFQESEQVVKERVWDRTVFGERLAFNVRVNQSRRTDLADQPGDVWEILANCVESHFPIAQPRAQPLEGDSGIIFSSSDLQNDPYPVGRQVEPGCCEEIVLDGLFVDVPHSVDHKIVRQVATSEGAQCEDVPVVGG